MSSLIKLLQEASSASLINLKKIIQKDPRVSFVLKRDSSFEDVKEPAEFLKTLKFHLLNNPEVISFMKERAPLYSRAWVPSLHEFKKLRQLRTDELDQSSFEWLKEFTSMIFKDQAVVERGTVSSKTKAEINDWVNGNSRFHSLSKSAEEELFTVPGIRPSKKIVVYRGVLFSKYDLEERSTFRGTLEKGNGLKFLEMLRDGGTEVDLTWDRQSSWTTDRTVAEKFAKFGPASSEFDAMSQWLERSSSKRVIDGDLGYVISTFADPKDIVVDLSLYGASINTKHGGEGEVILKAGTYLARVVKKYTVQGEVDPALKDVPASELPAAKVIEKLKSLKDVVEVPVVISVLDGVRHGFGQRLGYLGDTGSIRTLTSMTVTKETIKAFDGVLNIFNEHISHLSADDLLFDKYAKTPELRKSVKVLKEIFESLSRDVRHSKAKGEHVKLNKLSAEEFRSTLPVNDIKGLERDISTQGRVTDRYSARTLADISERVGVEVPNVSRLSQTGVAKQKPIIDGIVSAFYEKVGVAEPDGDKARVDGMFNLIRRADRNIQMLLIIKNVHELLNSLHET